MPTYAKLAALGAAAVAIVAIAMWQLTAAPGPGQPTATPTAPVPSIVATPAATPYAAPALSKVFTSGIYGLTVSYPEGWSVLAGTTPWTTTDPYIFQVPQGDFLYDPARDNLYIKIASQPLDGISFGAWSAAVMAGMGCTGSEAVVIDGAQGLINANCYVAVAPSGGRGYLIVGHWDYNLQELRRIDWAGWFRGVVASVQLHPEDAVDTN